MPANRLGAQLSNEWKEHKNILQLEEPTEGSWNAARMAGHRDSFKAMSGRIFNRGATMYLVNLDEDLGKKMYNFRSPFLPNIESLGALSRFSMNVPKKFPLGETSFGLGLFIYCTLIRKSGQHFIYRSLLGHLCKIDKLRKLFKRNGRLSPSGDCDDDFVRKMLKITSSWAFPKVFSKGPAYMFFMHIETMGGQSPWTEEQIIDDITKWTSGDSEGNLELLKPYYDIALKQWGRPNKDHMHMSFSDFCSDALRWGTSGGAKKATFFGEEFRSKWAWAFSRLIKPDGTLNTECDLYADAVAEGNVCKVALKEESKKTRQIITTPMASYLRQCYLVYRWGRLRGDTPISKATWLGNFQKQQYWWYGCADAERFDHSVSKEMVKYIVQKMGEVDDECAMVSKAELESLDDLTIEWGRHKWKYRGGLLSGWRLTSVIGTLTSMAIGKYVAERGHLGNATVAAMGDDIMLASQLHSLSKEQLYKFYAETGFNVNLQKTVTGRVGEFLRQTYSERGIIGYPALAVHSIIYAAPWLTHFELQHEQEISNSWLTLYSRFLPHALDVFALTDVIKKLITADVRQHSRISGDLNAWLNTPISAGGGGPIEWSNVKQWCTIVTDHEPGNNVEGLLGLFNIVPKALRVKRAISKRLVRMDMGSLGKNLDSIKRIVVDKDDIIPNHVNKTREILGWYLDQRRMLISHLERKLYIKLPRFLRIGDKLGILRYLLGISISASGITSVQTTSAATSSYSSVFKTIARVAAARRQSGNLKHLGALVTLFTMHMFGNDTFVSGTW